MRSTPFLFVGRSIGPESRQSVNHAWFYLALASSMYPHSSVGPYLGREFSIDPVLKGSLSLIYMRMTDDPVKLDRFLYLVRAVPFVGVGTTGSVRIH